MVHVPTKVNGYTKYEQDLLNTVDFKSGNKGGTDGRTDNAGHNNALRPEWAEGKNEMKWSIWGQSFVLNIFKPWPHAMDSLWQRIEGAKQFQTLVLPRPWPGLENSSRILKGLCLNTLPSEPWQRRSCHSWENSLYLVSMKQLLKSSRPSDGYMRQYTRPSLVR